MMFLNKKTVVIISLLLGMLKTNAQFTVYNDGMATVSIVSTCTVSILGGYTCQKKTGQNGNMDNQGVLQLTGDWNNNNTGAGSSPFSTSAGTVVFNGTGTQTIGGSTTTTFYNLTFNNNSAVAGDITLASNNYIASNQITMTQGNVNLNGRTLTLGTSTANVGTISYAAGFFYNNTGNFRRWISASSASMGAIASNNLGFFPMGTSTGNYRPLWLTYTSNLSSGGTISVLHDATTLTTSASHNDASWGTGTTVQAVTNSFWTIDAANSFSFNGSTGRIRYGGQGYGTNTLTDLDATLAASVVGTYGAATNANTTIEVNRTGLSTANIENSWRIGTKDIGQSPLPITLLSFDAKPNGNDVDLKWVTATENNNNFFTIEKSQDGTNFTNIGTVKGAGNSYSILNYSSVDDNPYKGISYYRLKQTDFDGNFSYSNIVAVEFGSVDSFNFNIYPNPSNANDINVSFGTTEKTQEILVVIRDVTGKENYSKVLVTKHDGENVFALDPLQKLSPGVYMITATSNQSVYSKRLIVK